MNQNLSSPRRSWIVLAVLLLIVAVLSFVDRAQIKQAFENIAALATLNGGYVTQKTTKAVAVSRIGWFGNHVLTTKSGTVLGYAPTSAGAYSLVLSPDGRDEYLTKLGSPDQKLDSIGGLKATLVASSDGTHIAYAQLAPAGFTRVGPSTNVRAWSMDLYDPKTKSSLVYDAAYAPQLFTSNGKSYLEFMSAGGMGMIDLSINELHISTTTVSADTQHPTYVSPNGTYALVYSLKAGSYSLYSITGSFPFSLKFIRSFSPAYEQVVGIDTKGFYVSAHTAKSNTSTISYLSFQQPTSPAWVYTLAGAQVSALIP